MGLSSSGLVALVLAVLVPTALVLAASVLSSSPGDCASSRLFLIQRNFVVRKTRFFGFLAKIAGVADSSRLFPSNHTNQTAHPLPFDLVGDPGYGRQTYLRFFMRFKR